MKVLFPAVFTALIAAMPSPPASAQPGSATLVDVVRQSTERFLHISRATSAGYGRLLGCTNGPDEGSMGVHYANPTLVGDGALDARYPEVLMYEPLADGEVVKVRYGADNGEVEGSVLATRLLWALGFGADAAYPVRVVCHGCSDDPWNKRGVTKSTHEFPIATIELKPAGHEIHGNPDGWSWAELNFFDDTQGGAPRHQRDALKLLAVLIQHTDNKAVQQRLQCLPGGLNDDGSCSKPLCQSG